MEAAVLPERPIEYCTRCPETCARKVRAKLAGAKTTLYNPYLASFKKAYHDTTLGKLSDEHSRTTLPYGIDSLSTDKYFNYDPPSCFIPKFGMMNLPEIENSEQEAELNESIRKTLEEVYQKTSGAFMMPIGRVIQIPTVKRISYLNFRVRLLTPEPSQKWRQFVHDKNLLYPYGGIEFLRNKYKQTETYQVAGIEGPPVNRSIDENSQTPRIEREGNLCDVYRCPVKEQVPSKQKVEEKKIQNTRTFFLVTT